MENNNQDKSFTYYLTEIKRRLDALEKYPESNVSDNATLLKEDLKELQKGFSGIKSTIIFTSILAFIFLCFSLFLLSNSKLSRNLIYGDFDATKDSILGMTSEENSTLNYRANNHGKIITYKDLTTKSDSLETVISKLEGELDLCNSKLNSVNDDLSIYKIKLDTKVNTENEIRSRFTEKFNKQIDSSFVLLEIFRGKMKYNEKKKEWSISLK